MNKKIWLKILSLSFATLFCLTALMGCGLFGKKEDEQDSNSDVVEDSVSDNEQTVVDVLEGVKYNGEVLKVLSWIPSNLKEYVPQFEAGAHVVEQKTYERMEKTKKQLNIGIEWLEEAGNGAAMSTFVEKAVNGIMGNEYDLIVCYSSAASTLTSSGYSANLMKYETLDFTREWYPQNLIEDCTIYDKLYFCTGDISTNLIYMTSMVFFNHALMDEYKINEQIQSKYGEENIYDLVREGKWTQEAMMTLSKGVFKDTDNSGSTTPTAGDTVGFSTYYTLLCNFYYGGGYKTINAGDTGVSLSEDYIDAGLVGGLLDEIGTFLHESGYAYFHNGHEEAQLAFSEGRVLFSMAPASHAYMSHAKSNVEFGALPIPKVSVDGDYHSVHSRPYSMYLIPNSSQRDEIAASFIQCLGQHSYSTTRTAIIQTTMKGRYASVNAEDAEMWDYIIASQTFDIGRVFETMFLHTNERANTDLFPVRLGENSTDWASIIEKYAQNMRDQCTDINSMLQAFGNE